MAISIALWILSSDFLSNELIYYGIIFRLSKPMVFPGLPQLYTINIRNVPKCISLQVHLDYKDTAYSHLTLV